MAKRHSVTVQSLIESTTSTTVPIGALQFHTSSTIHLAPCPHPSSIPMCSRPERHRRRGANTRGSQRWPRAMPRALCRAHSPQFSRISVWLGSCIPMCRPERHRGSTGAVATTRGSAVCGRARHLSRYSRRALRNSRAEASACGVQGTCTTPALANATCGERSARHQRCATEGRLEGAVPPSQWRVARREWRCAADAPHLTWCAAARPRIGCSAPPAWPARLKCS